MGAPLRWLTELFPILFEVTGQRDPIGKTRAAPANIVIMSLETNGAPIRRESTFGPGNWMKARFQKYALAFVPGRQDRRKTTKNTCLDT